MCDRVIMIGHGEVTYRSTIEGIDRATILDRFREETEREGEERDKDGKEERRRHWPWSRNGEGEE